MSNNELDILKRALAREKAARKQAEDILEKKSAELYDLNLQKEKAKKKLESLIKLKNSELKGFFENIIDPYIMMDLFGNVLKMNESAESLLAHKLSDGILNLMSITDPKDKKHIANSFETLLKTGKISNFEINLLVQHQQHILVSVNSSVIYNEYQNPVAAHGILRDITQLKKLENQKEALLKELEKSNENLKEYAHVVSHDLKSPLRSIDALLTWIFEDNKNIVKEDSLHHFELIKKTLERMENLISNILKYSTLDSNLEIKKHVDIHILLEHLLKVMYIPTNIKVAIQSQLPIVTVDSIKIEQLFQNLLGNAVKFNDKEVGSILIDVKDEGDYYQFSISDNGIGIDKKYHDKIFKVFHSLEKRKDSSGIGLSMVKKIVELHHGTIWLESELGNRTTFYFTLKK